MGRRSEEIDQSVDRKPGTVQFRAFFVHIFLRVVVVSGRKKNQLVIPSAFPPNLLRT
jgi:hypothetical protein